ncbi:MAG: hypothetical protein AB7F89_13935 [Pirellulaceae bacterium]
MSESWWLWVGTGCLIAISVGSFALVYAWPLISGREPLGKFDMARRSFHRRREWLEAKFLTLAAQSGKPRGLRWVDCEFDDDVAFARDRRTRRFRALVGVSILFEAIEGGDMEDVEAVANRKAATVVFRLDGPDWEVDGRALFNLNPAQTIEQFQHELEVVD